MAFKTGNDVKLKSSVADRYATAQPFKGLVGNVRKVNLDGRVTVDFPNGSLKCDESWLERA